MVLISSSVGYYRPPSSTGSISLARFAKRPTDMARKANKFQGCGSMTVPDFFCSVATAPLPWSWRNTMRGMTTLLLAFLIAMPQGWCCVARSVVPLIVASHDSATPESSCACCKVKAASLSQCCDTDKDASQQDSNSPNSCCKCSPQTGIAPDSLRFENASQTLCVHLEAYQVEVACVRPLADRLVSSQSPIRLQVLYCVWRC